MLHGAMLPERSELEEASRPAVAARVILLLAVTAATAAVLLRGADGSNRPNLVLLVGAFAGVVSQLGNVAPAAADSLACTPESRGCASFKQAGTTFDVCDCGFDGEAVAVQTGHGRIIAVN